MWKETGEGELQAYGFKYVESFDLSDVHIVLIWVGGLQTNLLFLLITKNKLQNNA